MEQEKISALVEENMKTIFAYALSRVSHREDAEDLAGDIILAILKSAPRIRDDNAFFGYIWAIAANTYKKYLYKKGRIRCEELDEGAADEKDFVQDILQTEQFSALRRELALLSREYRECTVAYYFEGLSCGETAARLHLSLEMVKYYLFKTRKLLKEGIGMEREFGTKSYQPAKFEFTVIFQGAANMEYQRLFDRKLPGNILVSTYHTPMTIRQLAIELGVASVYLEDEIALLERYGLLTALTGGRYQARLVIFTEEYMEEFFRTAEKSYVPVVGDILISGAQKLPELRKLGFPGADMEDGRLLWNLLFWMMNEGCRLFRDSRKMAAREDVCGDICYGSTFTFQEDHPCWSRAFAGYCGLHSGYAACYADYGILPSKNRYASHGDEIARSLEAVLEGKAGAMVPVFAQGQKERLNAVFREEIASFAGLYESLYDCGLAVMGVHAPKSVGQILEPVMSKVLLFHTVGLIGSLAVRSGALAVPEDNGPLGGFVYRIS